MSLLILGTGEGLPEGRRRLVPEVAAYSLEGCPPSQHQGEQPNQFQELSGTDRLCTFVQTKRTPAARSETMFPLPGEAMLSVSFVAGTVARHVAYEVTESKRTCHASLRPPELNLPSK